MYDKMGMVLTQLVCHLNLEVWNFSLNNFWKIMISSFRSDQAGQVGVTISIKTFFVRFPAVPIWISLHQFKTGDQFRHFLFTRSTIFGISSPIYYESLLKEDYQLEYEKILPVKVNLSILILLIAHVSKPGNVSTITRIRFRSRINLDYWGYHKPKWSSE